MINTSNTIQTTTRAIERFNSTIAPRIFIGVILAAFILSYVALFETANAAGFHWTLALLWPLILDGVVIVASLDILKRNLRGDKARFSWFLLVAFDLSSIALNGMMANRWDYILIHALPPAVLWCCLKIYTNSLKDELAYAGAMQNLENVTQAATETKQHLGELSSELEKLALQRGKLEDDVKALKREKRSKNGAVSPLNGVPLAVANQALQDKMANRRKQLVTILEDEPELTHAQLADRLGVSTGTIKNDKKALNGNLVEEVAHG